MRDNISGTTGNGTAYTLGVTLGDNSLLCTSARGYECLQLLFNYTEFMVRSVFFNLARVVEYDPKATLDHDGKYSSANMVALEAKAHTMRECMNVDSVAALVNRLVGSIFSPNSGQTPTVSCSDITPYVSDLRILLNTDAISTAACDALKSGMQSEFLKCSRENSVKAAQLLWLLFLLVLVAAPIYACYKERKELGRCVGDVGHCVTSPFRAIGRGCSKLSDAISKFSSSANNEPAEMERRSPV